MNHPALRLTPSNSPFFKNTTPRSPTKASKHEEPGLRLSKVIGTTTTSANGFDSLPEARKFAYTAGAAAVVATVDLNGTVAQAFFRARPNVSSNARESDRQWPASPTPTEPRSRALNHVRDHSSGSPLATSSRDWSDSPTGRTLTAKDRVKAATSVALSPNGRWLAVGETGYKPRVLIFSLADGSSETPVAALGEHTFGVHALSFSPDSRFLASLGTVNDGFLYVWSIDERTGGASLHSSNKCTTIVNCMCWMGQSIVTVGLRFVKVWRLEDDGLVESRKLEPTLGPPTLRHRADHRSSDFGNSLLNPKHKVLAGKNSLLGDMLDANFVSTLAINQLETLICAESGTICLLNDAEKAQIVTAISTVDFEITSARLDSSGRVHVVGPTGCQKTLDSNNLYHSPPPFVTKQQRRKTISPNKAAFSDGKHVVATATMGNTIVELDSHRGIALRIAANGSAEEESVDRIAAHGDAVLGAQAVDCSAMPTAAFLTFSGNGTIQIWDDQGKSLAQLSVPIETSPEMYDLTNELKAVAPMHRGECLAAGDKYGTLIILGVQDESIIARVRAHSSEIVAIAAFQRNDLTFVVTGSRDRTIQSFVWQNDQLDLLQTMDEHAAAITGVLVTPDGNRLLSCSADRSIVVREAMLRDESNAASLIFAITRTIPLKTSPTAMCIGAEKDDLLVAATDRSITKYNVKSKIAGFSFKCSDADAGEPVVISKMLFASSLNGNPTIVGVSSSDKSVRLYTEFGSIIARDYGHTEGITDVILLPNKGGSNEGVASQKIVTVAADSTIFMWDTSPAPASASRSRQASETKDAADTAPTPKPFVMNPPMRKVISYAELSRFRQEPSIEENEPTSPNETRLPSLPASPQRLRRKISRMSFAQTPRLEPAFQPGLGESSRRISLRQRSPSPPSPRNIKKGHIRRPSLGMPARSKSSENVLNTPSSTTTSGTSNSNFGSLTASTESICRGLRAYRKRLATSPSNDNIAPETLRELEKELKLTARALGEKSQGKTLDESMMAKLLDQASEKIVGMLDERIKERVESEVRKSSEGSPATATQVEHAPSAEVDDKLSADAVAGALERVALRDSSS